MHSEIFCLCLLLPPVEFEGAPSRNKFLDTPLIIIIILIHHTSYIIILPYRWQAKSSAASLRPTVQTGDATSGPVSVEGTPAEVFASLEKDLIRQVFIRDALNLYSFK